jgi:hypothetical protein
MLSKLWALLKDPSQRRVAIAVTLSGAAFLIFAGSVLFATFTSGNTLAERMFPPVLAYRFLSGGAPLSATEKIVLLALVYAFSMALVLFKAYWSFWYPLLQIAFGIAMAWYTLSYQMSSSRPVNSFLLLGSAWLIADAIETDT